jgi:alkylation response protein AidB-like acyl-CoA dehydrogenase
LSEPGSGSDCVCDADARVEKGDHYLLNGASSGSQTESKPTSSFCCECKSEAGYRGITAFIVEKEFPGFLDRQEGEQTRHSRVVNSRA